MPDTDTILAVFQSGIDLAGLLLVFSGFLLSKADSFNSTRRGEKYRKLFYLTLIPLLAALFESFISLLALRGNQWSGGFLILGMEVSLILTALFAIIGILVAA